MTCDARVKVVMNSPVLAADLSRLASWKRPHVTLLVYRRGRRDLRMQ